MFLHFLQSVCESLLVAGVSLRASHIKDASSGQLASGLWVPWPSVGAGKRGVHAFDLLGSLWRSWQPVLKKVKTEWLGSACLFYCFLFRQVEMCMLVSCHKLVFGILWMEFPTPQNWTAEEKEKHSEHAHISCKGLSGKLAKTKA